MHWSWPKLQASVFASFLFCFLFLTEEYWKPRRGNLDLALWNVQNVLVLAVKSRCALCAGLWPEEECRVHTGFWP